MKKIGRLSGSTEDLLYIGDFNGNFEILNTAWEEIMGYSIGELKSKHILNFVHPEDVKKTQLKFENLRKNNSPEKVTNRVLCKNGNYIELIWDLKINIKANKIIGTARAIYKEKGPFNTKQLNQQIENNNNGTRNTINLDHWRDISQTIPTGVFVTDKEGFCTYTNSKFHFITGFNFDQALGKGLKEKIHKEDINKINECRHILFEKKKIAEKIIRFYHANGQLIWILVKMAPIKTGDNIEGVVGTIEDITERIEIYEQLKFNEQLLNKAFKEGADGLIISLADDHKIISCNKRALELFEVENENDLIGTYGPSLRKEPINDEELAAIKEKFQQNKPYVNEITYLTKRGNELSAKITIKGFSANGKGYELVQIEDINIRKQKEDELKATMLQAEKATQSKTRFLANMSHEIRTPINAILGFTEIMEKQNLNKTEQIQYLQYITSSGQLLLKLIGDVLDLSKIEEGKMTLNINTFNFKEFISSHIIPYKYKANEKGLDFNLYIDENIPPFLVGDPDKINQVLVNLIGNAIKFTKHGYVNVTISLLNNVFLNKDAVIKFSVSDSGIGIPIEKQSTVFDAFTQADTFINKQFGGSGLGLAIVKELLRLMGSEIRIENPARNKDKQGTTFVFTLKLPINNEFKNNHNTQNLKIKKPSFRGINVLVVEDNTVNQKLIEVFLRDLQCNFEIANNGEEAIERFKNSKFDLVFMDVQMPVMDGYETTKIIRQKYNKEIPIIGLSANVYKEDIEKCLKTGMSDFLGKPFTEGQLTEIIKKWTLKNEDNTNNKSVKGDNDNFVNFLGKNHVSKLNSSLLTDPEIAKDLISSMIKSLDDFIIKIEIANKNEDWDEVRFLCHKMKSSLIVIGFSEMGEILASIENCCKIGDPSKIPHLLKKTQILYHKVKEDLNVELLNLAYTN